MEPIPSPIRPESRAVLRRIEEISGQNVFRCMQCGTCSAVCPMVESMGMTTRQAIHELQFGRVQRVMDARIGEFCASCLTCAVRCPRDIDVPRVFEAVRQLVLRTNVDLVPPESIPKERMEEAPQIAFVATFRKMTG